MCCVGIDAAGEQHGRHLPSLPGQCCRLLPRRDRVQIDHAPEAVRLGLQRYPIADGAEIVAEGRNAGGLDAGEHALHGNALICERPFSGELP